MKRLACAAAIVALAVAAPAAALPNAIRTVGSDLSGAGKHVAVGRMAAPTDDRLAAIDPAEPGPAVMPAADPQLTLSEATTLPEPDPVAAAVAMAASILDEPTLPAADQRPGAAASLILVYDLAGL